ncbi:DUF305 domain-containing protein [Microbacterium rhizomatis]|uniref:DUF305 domain-containing protein n=2 Tax=Microbacterium rhizomatis TaxID=1631477 RepID=A0A5J5J634_9MICO|nr:DUF305 domain-containing protein [Microbacterium rhizomatis]KAA9111677.1 DUF305 domain-containing protein [Microbacterium rhizomatis]
MKTRAAATAAITLTAVLALAGCAGSDSGPAHANAADIMFASMMIPHHVQAVEMSDALLSKEGVDERIVALAEQVVSAQQPEIDLMENWLADWGAEASDLPTGTDMGHSGGMMSDGDMRALDTAVGDEAGRLYVAQMIDHHRGAIDMARGEIQKGQNPDAVALAQQIIATQTVEIDTLEDVLATS